MYFTWLKRLKHIWVQYLKKIKKILINAFHSWSWSLPKYFMQMHIKIIGFFLKYCIPFFMLLYGKALAVHPDCLKNLLWHVNSMAYHNFSQSGWTSSEMSMQIYFIDCHFISNWKIQLLSVYLNEPNMVVNASFKSKIYQTKLNLSSLSNLLSVSQPQLG
jgi:hypothetical protein